MDYVIIGLLLLIGLFLLFRGRKKGCSGDCGSCREKHGNMENKKESGCS